MPRSRPAETFIVAAALCLCACKPPEESQQKAIIGAVLIDGTGGPPMSDSVVVIAGSRIRAIGHRANMPIPAGVDKINGMSRFLVPGLIDLYARVEHNTVQGASPEDARHQVDAMATRQVSAILIPVETKPAVADAILDEARKFNIPVTADIDSLAATERLVRSGAAGFLHMIQDTEDIDPAFLTRLRDLRIVFTPLLATTDSQHLARALRNTGKLAAAGVPIGVGWGGAAMSREIALLAQAGLSPSDILLAATRTGAFALRKTGDLGTIEPGRFADLILLTANPLEDARNLEKVDRVMIHGEWVERNH